MDNGGAKEEEEQGGECILWVRMKGSIFCQRDYKGIYTGRSSIHGVSHVMRFWHSWECMHGLQLLMPFNQICISKDRSGRVPLVCTCCFVLGKGQLRVGHGKGRGELGEGMEDLIFVYVSIVAPLECQTCMQRLSGNTGGQHWSSPLYLL